MAQTLYEKIPKKSNDKNTGFLYHKIRSDKSKKRKNQRIKNKDVGVDDYER